MNLRNVDNVASKFINFKWLINEHKAKGFLIHINKMAGLLYKIPKNCIDF